MLRSEKLSVARRTASEGMVLLRNHDKLLPIPEKTSIALFGTTAYFCHRMGFGSGDMLAQPPVQYAEGLADAGLVLDANIVSFYRTFLNEKKDAFDRTNRDWAKWTTRFPEADPPQELIEAAAKRNSIAIISIGRNSGESIDLSDGLGSFRLSIDEDRLIHKICTAFDRVVVLLNVCGVIDTSFLDRYPINAVLLTGLCGETSGLAVADVVTGRVSPSGHLAETWAKRYRDYPTTDCFGTMEVPFHEGIYVGYRYFDTFGIEPRFHFGFGLSYTEFNISVIKTSVDNGTVSMDINVENIGSRSGSESVQCYLSCPDGKLEKPYQDLCAYKKTAVIEPGASTKITLSFYLADFASYCDKCESYVLEAGDYIVRVGNSSRSTHAVARLRLTETIKTLSAKKCFDGWQNEINLISKKGTRPFSYKDEANEIAAAHVFLIPSTTFNTNAVPETPDAKLLIPKSTCEIHLSDVATGRETLEELVSRFDDYELASMINGVVYEEIKNLTVGGMAKGKVHGEAGEFWHNEKYGIPVNNCADGPSGVRQTNFGQESEFETESAKAVVAYPCGTIVAQTWNSDLARAFGACVCEDLKLSDIDGWLAPGVNIKRNPLCGRNFEYFSEDPLLSGSTGAAIVRGVQENPDGTPTTRYATVKHYAVNSQEFERGMENNIVSERALREIYLKAFKIAVREGKPLAVMTSYNKINGEYAATNYSLLNLTLRSEFGFDGMVMTDWWNSADPLKHYVAGNDMIMPGVKDRRLLVENAIKNGRINRADAQTCAVRVLKLILHCLR